MGFPSGPPDFETFIKAVDQVSETIRSFYVTLKARGFDEEQAMRLTEYAMKLAVETMEKMVTRYERPAE